MRSLLSNLINNVRFYKSLKFRIFIIVLIIGIIPAVVMRRLIVNSYESRALSQKTAEVTNQTAIVAAHLARTDYLSDMSDPIIDDELTQMSNLYDGRVLVIDSYYKVVKDTYGKSQGRYIVSNEVIACMNGSRNMSNFDEVNNYLEITVPILDESTGMVYGAMVASASTDGIKNNVQLLDRRSYTIGVVIAILVLLIAYALSNTLLRPFDKIIKAVDSVREGFEPGAEAIEVPDYTETKDIMDAFHHLMSRMREVDESREEFVANVSHELKTPLASMKVLSDSLIQSGENVDAETYREFMVDIAAEVDRENKVINDLLSLVKLDGNETTKLNLESCSISDMLQQILKTLTPLADNAGVELLYDEKIPVEAKVDEVKLSLAIMNLVENAIKYNKEGGWVKVTLDADAQFMMITVSDSGMGIPEESLNRIYDRFYRVDKSHSREIGGTGLGLSITRNAILLHRGAIKAASIVGEGTTFTVKIPLGDPV
ncbi:MAG: HAMP domain-containing histidine kinase [Lachnospiraceae bacterium]|nr:HAMP domain-containing histidine kinase [Lachnospiraceae bacterium]MBR1914331.1 HAMP domain-containing histidine kinase [Lachnospiraceae bacterium]